MGIGGNRVQVLQTKMSVYLLYQRPEGWPEATVVVSGIRPVSSSDVSESLCQSQAGSRVSDFYLQET